MIDEHAFSDLPPVVWNILESPWEAESKRLFAFFDSAENGSVSGRRRIRDVDRERLMQTVARERRRHGIPIGDNK